MPFKSPMIKMPLSKYTVAIWNVLHAKQASVGWQSAEELRRRVAVFTPAFEQLVALLRGRVRYPADWESWEEDDRDDFRRARQDVGDALLDAAGECVRPRLHGSTTHPVTVVQLSYQLL